MARDDEAYMSALEGKSIPILTLDNKWHQLFTQTEMTPEIVELSDKLNSLVERDGKIRMETKKIKKLKKPEIEEKVKTIARKVDLSDEQLAKAVSQLSGGQQQRVAIARALVTEPAIICMDEPLSNLDAKLRVQLRNELKKMQREFGITTIYVTHDQEEALTLSDRIAVFNKGYIEQIGTPNEIYNHSKTEFVANFIGDINPLGAGVVQGLKLPADGHHFVRLERVRVNRPQEADEFQARGVIQSREYYGLYIKYYIEAAGQTVKVIEKNDGINIYEPGDSVTVGIHPQDVMSY